MAEWIISSSVLILMILLLRLLLRRRAAPGLIYALWLPVLLRLLLPFSLGESRVSVMNTLAPSPAYIQTAVMPAPEPEQAETVDNAPEGEITEAAENRDKAAPAVITIPEELTRQLISWRMLLFIVWLIGLAVVLVWTLVSNLGMALELRADRRRMQEPWAVEPKRVYISRPIRSPCLFGVLRPAIYLTPEIAADQWTLGHVLAHERAHYRHGDQIWGLLRVLALALHWYNPLVWLASALSRQDAETAADASAIAALGEKERLDYGETLISLVQRKPRAADYLNCGTTMFGAKHVVRERIRLIARKPRTAAITLILVLAVSAAAVACTFTGSGQKLFPGEEELRPTLNMKSTFLELGVENTAQAEGESPDPAREDYLDQVLSSKLFAHGTAYSQEECLRLYGVPLAEPAWLPEDYLAYDKVFVVDVTGDDRVFSRLWYSPERREMLRLLQYYCEIPEVGTDFRFSSGDETEDPFLMRFPWANYRALMRGSAGDWTVEAFMLVKSPDREIECEKICRSVNLQGQPLNLGPAPEERQLSSFSGNLETASGEFSFYAELCVQAESSHYQYLSFTDPSGLTQRLGFPLSSAFDPDTLSYIWQAEDVDGDGSQDLLLDMGEYQGGPRAMCFLFDGKKNGYVPLAGFDRYIFLGFDREGGYVCSAMGSGSLQSFEKIRVVEGRMELMARVTINYGLPEEQRCSEYADVYGKWLPVKDRVPQSEINWDDWPFAKPEGSET